MKDALVTVVVPIYNVEQYLDRCIKSIVNQTYHNLEIILVDDGSPDNCPAMCDEWAQKDQRIKVIHKENAGLGMARNTGIEHATGEYICFFDSDDYIELTTIEECYRAIKSEKADLVCFGHDKVTQDGKVVGQHLPSPPKSVFIGDEIRKQLMPMTLSHDARTGEDWKLPLSACFYMFSMRIIQKKSWRFVSEREIISEDYYSVLEYYQYAKIVVFIDKIFYHYTTNVNSLSQSYRPDRYEKIKYFAFKLEELSKKMNCDEILQDRIPIVFLGLTIGALKQIVSNRQSLSLKCKELKTVINDEFIQEVLRTNDFSGENIPKKVLYCLIKHKLVLLCYFIIVIRNLNERER